MSRKTYREMIEEEWEHPKDEQDVENKLYGLELVMMCIDAELEKSFFMANNYRKFGWLPGHKEGKLFRMKENEARNLLQAIKSGLESERRKLKKKLKQNQNDA